ncbi:MAG: L-histidine N(alpha)-methyltransferase [Sphaerospermopsis sp. SIO1G2]|nr:L-histidine N(alpha)-methyltransferase [Sphaerospermopsis sp. SIO1G1]NET70129.1 L-histidine N(alpha)-methyltransferase [Sphaerospermopsis sp. SIO1G2]
MTNVIGDKKVVHKLEEDAKAFFLDQLDGNLWPYLYGTPEDENDLVTGGILYNEILTQEPDYYLYKYEAELFQNKGDFLTNIIGSDATIIELGPGSEQSVRLKTIPLLRSFINLKGYLGIEISQSFLDKALAVISSELPNIHVSGIQNDFTQLESLPEFDKPVILFKGSTIGNLRKDEVQDFMSYIKNLVGKTHYVLLVHDANQDEVSLMKAYNTPKVAMFVKNIIFRFHRDMNLVDLDPSAFRYQSEWHSESHDLKHILTATKSQKFVLGNQTVEIKEGQKFHTLSSFKYPTDVFQKLISSAGYKPVDFTFDESGRMAAHIFEG